MIYDILKFDKDFLCSFQKNRQTIIANRFDKFSLELNIERQKLVDWSFVQAILSGCWAIQDRSESYKYWLECAELIERAS